MADFQEEGSQKNPEKTAKGAMPAWKVLFQLFCIQNVSGPFLSFYQYLRDRNGKTCILC